MTVEKLISELENFPKDMPVVIGMKQKYGSNFAMNIDPDIYDFNISKFYGNDIKAVVITEDNQIGVVDYEE